MGEFIAELLIAMGFQPNLVFSLSKVVLICFHKTDLCSFFVVYGLFGQSCDKGCLLMDGWMASQHLPHLWHTLWSHTFAQWQCSISTAIVYYARRK